MSKRQKKRQSTLPKVDTKPVPELEKPYARALLYSISIVATVILGLVVGKWYEARSQLDTGASFNSPLWKVVDLPGRGKGVIATRNITQGTLILREAPLFTVPPSIKQSPQDLIISLVSRLSTEQREQFNALSHHARPDAKGSQIPLATFETNAISAGDVVGIFPRVARLNHGCSSAFNIAYDWRETEQALVLHAFKPIAEGEELLISYTDTKKARNDRQSYLRNSYNFQCQCAVCSLPPEDSKLSDIRLMNMALLRTDLSKWGEKKIGGKEATTIVNKIWKLGEEEGYWSERGALAWDATRVAASHWHEEATRNWAMLANKWFSIELGADSWRAKDAAQIVRKPKSHPHWGERYQMEVDLPVASVY